LKLFHPVQVLLFDSQAASGLPIRNVDLHAAEICEFAVSMLHEAKAIRDPIEDDPVQLRIGINSGKKLTSVNFLNRKKTEFILKRFICESSVECFDYRTSSGQCDRSPHAKILHVSQSNSDVYRDILHFAVYSKVKLAKYLTLSHIDITRVIRHIYEKFFSDLVTQ
jgi:hypothetical protein